MSQQITEGLKIPDVTVEQMREVDRLMIEEYEIDLLRMMENAGRALAELTRRMMGGSVEDRKVIVAAGKGNNGGGGLVAARHLHNWGAEVIVLLPGEGLKPVPEKQLKIIEKLSVRILRGGDAIGYLSDSRPDIAVDALIGYGIKGDPRGWVADAINGLNRVSCPVLSLDIPSGLDATTGRVYNPCVRADATMTLALPKTGLLTGSAREVAGKIYLADISVPAELYRQMGLDVGTLFPHDSIIDLQKLQER